MPQQKEKNLKLHANKDFMIPVGVIEVKKLEDEIGPDGESVLDKPTVLGEMYDFKYSSKRPAFGILTTFECWRVCWIPEADVDVDSVAETSESLPKSEATFTTPEKEGGGEEVITPSAHSKQDQSCFKRYCRGGRDNEEWSESGEDRRVLHMSKMYRGTDDGHFCER